MATLGSSLTQQFGSAASTATTAGSGLLGSLGSLVGGLSTTGAQWYQLISSGGNNISVPPFTGASAAQEQAVLSQNAMSEFEIIAVVGLVVLGAYFVLRKK